MVNAAKTWSMSPLMTMSVHLLLSLSAMLISYAVFFT
jgi:hypothetical protein